MKTFKQLQYYLNEKKKFKGQIIAYHGTNKEFDEFNSSMIGSQTDSGFLGKGFYFSTDKNIGKGKKFTKKVLLNIKNPLVIKFNNWNDDKRELVLAALNLKEPFNSSKISVELKKKKHDSIILDYSPVGYKQQEIMVLDSNSIKNI